MKTVAMNTTMREAFLCMKVKSQHHRTHTRVLTAAGMAINSHVGEKKVPEWNAHLKFQTHKKLVASGVMVH